MFAEFLLLFLTFPCGHAYVGLTVWVIMVYQLVLDIELLTVSEVFLV